MKVPEVYAAPVLRVEREKPYTEEDFARFKEVVSEAEGIQWNENEYPPENNTDLNSCTSKDDRYFVSFSKGPGGRDAAHLAEPASALPRQRGQL